MGGEGKKNPIHNLLFAGSTHTISKANLIKIRNLMN
jgi:hypothetical protein